MNEMNDIRFEFPAHLLKCAPTDRLLQAAKASRAIDDTVFEENSPFFFIVEMSNDQLDSYYTRMDITTLRNFAEDANAGLPFLDSHIKWRLPLGSSVSGRFEETEGRKRVVAEFFTIKGLKFNDASYSTSDDFINSVRAGIARDVSQSFYFTNTDPDVFAGYRCDICNTDLWSYECRHIPGVAYEIEENGRVARVIATATVINAHASEVSAVYNGSTPGASILKAEREMDAGRLEPKVARMLEERYRHLNLRLPDARHIIALGNVEGNMAEEPTTIRITDGRLLTVAEIDTAVKSGEGVRAALDEFDLSKGKEATEGVRALLAEITRLRTIEESVASIRAQAEDGKQYRADLITKALAEGVRALGDKFDETGKRAFLEKCDIATIRELSESWRVMGDEKFKGGRQTNDDAATDEPGQSARRVTPEAAYKN